ncbi:MAG TPA: hypothetical protein VGM03_09920, partial [Phycisphaerae bacterium]
PLAVQRDISDVTLDWRCMHGHRFRAAGSIIELPCPECGEPSQAVIPYVCAGHGRQDLEVRFGPPRHRTWPTVLAVRSEGGEWRHVDHSIPCPECGADMQPLSLGWSLP